ncbi:hypothetical protein GGF44_003632 [Coemansia sp. RSA 1694]|nr:hypothetical protein GGH95_000084 [Coemansia sp. RSA 1836]KAJ2634032.1 hypothetical protein GGF44_003632 [Coemansia sp. RSA 1694]
MKLSLFAAVFAASSIAAPIGLNIPGILNLDIGGGNGLNLNVLGGLVHANIGGRGSKTPRATPRPVTPIAAPTPPMPAFHATPAVPAVPAIPAFYPF